MEKNVTLNGESVSLRIEVKRLDKYNHILVLNNVEYPVKVITDSSAGVETLSYYDYRGQKVVDGNGNPVKTDRGLVEYLLSKS
ncbi:hypothetical protein [Rufibacter tibetensis]|nr:hypothetical protein [Rufibacter tibetensis]